MNGDVPKGDDPVKKLILVAMMVLASLMAVSSAAMAEPRTGGPLPIRVDR